TSVEWKSEPVDHAPGPAHSRHPPCAAAVPNLPEDLLKLAYFPGCSAQSTCKELNASTRLVAHKLGLELHEYRSSTCTGSRELRPVPPELFHAPNARTLAMAERDGLPLMTICNTCTLNFLDVIRMLGEDGASPARVNAALEAEGLRYQGSVVVKH